MFEGTQELAENKLLLLYIFDKINHPLSNAHITEIVLQNNLLNYFHLQQYLGELADSGFLALNKEDKKQIYSLSDNGKNVLEYFQNRISDNKKNVIDTYIQSLDNSIEKKLEITAQYFPVSNGSGYTVICRMVENNISLMELKLAASSLEDCAKMCSNWKSHGYQIYNKIINALED